MIFRFSRTIKCGISKFPIHLISLLYRPFPFSLKHKVLGWPFLIYLLLRDFKSKFSFPLLNNQIVYNCHHNFLFIGHLYALQLKEQTKMESTGLSNLQLIGLHQSRMGEGLQHWNRPPVLCRRGRGPASGLGSQQRRLRTSKRGNPCVHSHLHVLQSVY